LESPHRGQRGRLPGHALRTCVASPRAAPCRGGRRAAFPQRKSPPRRQPLAAPGAPPRRAATRHVLGLQLPRSDNRRRRGSRPCGAGDRPGGGAAGREAARRMKDVTLPVGRNRARFKDEEADVKGLLPDEILDDATAKDSEGEVDDGVSSCASAPNISEPRFPKDMTLQRKKSFGSMAMERLRVHCHGASQLQAGGLFKGANPYAVLYLSDSRMKESPRRRTKVCNGTSNPRWQQDVFFAVKKSTEALTLHVEVWSWSDEDRHEFCGHGCLDLVGLMANPQREVQEIALGGHRLHGGHGRVKGTFRLEVGWDMSLVMDSPTISGDKDIRVVKELLNSPQAMRIIRVMLWGTAGIMQLIAAQARWLCRGPSLAECEPVTVPGVATAATLACLCTLTSTMVHLAGSLGCLGPDWTGEPLKLQTFLETAREDEGHRAGWTVHMKSTSMSQWSFALEGSIFPKVPSIATQLILNFAFLSSTLLSFLSAFLAWVEEGDSMVLGEAVYLNIGGWLLLVSGGLTSLRERRLLVKAEGALWRDVSQNTRQTVIPGVNKPSSIGNAWPLFSENGFGNGELSPALEDMAQKASDALKPLQRIGQWWRGEADSPFIKPLLPDGDREPPGLRGARFGMHATNSEDWAQFVHRNMRGSGDGKEQGGGAGSALPSPGSAPTDRSTAASSHYSAAQVGKGVAKLDEPPDDARIEHGIRAGEAGETVHPGEAWFSCCHVVKR